VLYYKGEMNLNHPRTVGIVGTRKPTEWGKINCEKLVEGLKDYGVQIISGLAFGIDSCAHRAAVDHDIETIGVTAHGLDRLYPAQNADLAKKMIQKGGVLCEYPTGTKPPNLPIVTTKTYLPFQVESQILYRKDATN